MLCIKRSRLTVKIFVLISKSWNRERNTIDHPKSEHVRISSPYCNPKFRSRFIFVWRCCRFFVILSLGTWFLTLTHKTIVKSCFLVRFSLFFIKSKAKIHQALLPHIYLLAVGKIFILGEFHPGHFCDMTRHVMLIWIFWWL